MTARGCFGRHCGRSKSLPGRASKPLSLRNRCSSTLLCIGPHSKTLHHRSYFAHSVQNHCASVLSSHTALEITAWAQRHFSSILLCQGNLERQLQIILLLWGGLSHSLRAFCDSRVDSSGTRRELYSSGVNLNGTRRTLCGFRASVSNVFRTLCGSRVGSSGHFEQYAVLARTISSHLRLWGELEQPFRANCRKHRQVLCIRAKVGLERSGRRAKTSKPEGN